MTGEGKPPGTLGMDRGESATLSPSPNAPSANRVHVFHHRGISAGDRLLNSYVKLSNLSALQRGSIAIRNIASSGPRELVYIEEDRKHAVDANIEGSDTNIDGDDDNDAVAESVKRRAADTGSVDFGNGADEEMVEINSDDEGAIMMIWMTMMEAYEVGRPARPRTTTPTTPSGSMEAVTSYRLRIYAESEYAHLNNGSQFQLADPFRTRTKRSRRYSRISSNDNIGLQ